MAKPRLAHTFRLGSVTHTPQPNAQQKRDRQRRTPHDTVPGRTAREWFAVLKPMLLDSRPLIEHEQIEKRKRGDHRPPRLIKPAVYGRPTFQNTIDRQTGALV